MCCSEHRSTNIATIHSCAAVNITALTELQFIHEQQTGSSAPAISSLIRIFIRFHNLAPLVTLLNCVLEEPGSNCGRDTNSRSLPPGKCRESTRNKPRFFFQHLSNSSLSANHATLHSVGPLTASLSNLQAQKSWGVCVAAGFRLLLF
jgi:hypothetical protein